MDVITRLNVFVVSILFTLAVQASEPYSPPGKEKVDLVPIFMCVWDPIGKAGPVGQIMKEATIQAYKWGVDLTFEVFSDERIAIDEFKLGRCDAVNMLGFRAREFNSCLLYTSPSPRDKRQSRMPSSA